MSTSDLPGGVGDLDNVLDLTGSKAARAAGLPDPAQLAKLAAEFFGALPSEATMDPAQIAGMPALPGTPSIPSAAGIPSSAGMPGIPSTPEVPAMPAMSLPPEFAFV